MPGSVEGLPFRLIIAAVVAALTMPPILAGLSAYEVHQVGMQVLEGVESVVRIAQRLYLAGGGSQDVLVDLGGGLTVRVEYVAFGDVADGPLSTTARFKVTGQRETFVVTSPPVPLAGPEGPLYLGPGRHTVRVTFEGEGPVLLAAI